MFKQIILMLLLALNFASAAVIQGTVYDLSLKPVDKSIVEINSMPQQRFVALDGKYLFNLQKGSYTITARSGSEIAEENITINDDGIYNLDLFLFPLLDDEITEEPSIDMITDITNYKPYIFSIALVMALVFGIVFYKFRHKVTKRSKGIQQPAEYFLDDKQKIINIIKKHGNRTTQKEIRKEITLSEAKVSLIIAELEHENRIKKIKRGRGNIIILNEPGSISS